MYVLFAARGAIGREYSSNHNGGEAVDMSFSPAWGIGCTAKNASGKDVTIRTMRDILNIGFSYSVMHWECHGPKRQKDPVHWSRTGG